MKAFILGLALLMASTLGFAATDEEKNTCDFYAQNVARVTSMYRDSGIPIDMALKRETASEAYSAELKEIIKDAVEFTYKKELKDTDAISVGKAYYDRCIAKMNGKL